MGDDDHGDAQALVDIGDQLQDGAGGVGVQGGGGLVAQEDLGRGGQGTGDGDALLLSAGELGGIGVGLVGEAHQLQQLQRLLPGLLFGHAVDLHGEADIFQTGPLHEQVEALENHADGAPGGAQLLGGEGGDVLPAEEDLAVGGPLQQVHAPHQCALARAGQADDAEDVAGLDGEVDVLQGRHSAFAGAEGLA